MPEAIDVLLKHYTKELCYIYGEHLKVVLLYGSYARGYFKENSDIDIMILVDLSEEAIKEYGKKLSDLTFDYNIDYDLMVMPIVKNMNHFKYWLSAYSFYKNVQQEGVTLYAA